MAKPRLRKGATAHFLIAALTCACFLVPSPSRADNSVVISSGGPQGRSRETLAQVSSPSPSPSASPPTTPVASPLPVAPPAPGAPTPPPITVSPASAMVPVNGSARILVGSVLGPIAAVAANPALIDVSVDQPTQTISIVGKAAGVTTVTVSDSRGLRRDVVVRVAYYAGNVPTYLTLEVTGDPASAEFVRRQVAGAILRSISLRPGAQAVVGSDNVPFNGTLAQDRIANVSVPVLLQGNAYIEVDANVNVEIRNVAAPRISPDSLMVSDYPERLEENGQLFAADLKSEQPSRFLYFHYNPPGQPERRVVLRADNHSSEPAVVQFISGYGGPSSNEMDVGHRATKDFLVNLTLNQGRLITIGANASLNVAQQDMPPGTIVANLLQMRVLQGSGVHLTLFAQSADASPDEPLAAGELLEGSHPHARGIYPIPEFYYATQWSVNDEYLELPVGQIPLPNDLHGQALAGDYGVLQSFVVVVTNPMSTPQTIAVYENPRGGRATGTYLIDGQLVQSHQVPPYSRYKIRQYVVPARGFVRVTIVTMPEAGSSYPLRLIFAPDDGSVAPGAGGSPVY